MPDLFAFNPNTFNLGNYSLTISQGIYVTKIKMNCLTSVVNTYQLPYSYRVLEEQLPSIFKSKCFNEQDNPFIVEAKKTELGHLFEHIMLEYICMCKVARGVRKVSVSGITDWNWRKDPYGTYNITLEIGKTDKEVIDEAFKKSIALFDTVVNTKRYHMKKQTARS